MKAPSLTGLLIAGNASNSGKTTTSLGLIKNLQRHGFEVFAAKSGPDYIDRSWLALGTGRAVLNLDLWMAAANRNFLFRQMLAHDNVFHARSVLLVEGAMGLYDGRAEGDNSCAQLALLLNLPVLLCLNIAGMGQSAAALAQGFLNYKLPHARKKLQFLGIICTHSASARHEELIRKALEPMLEKIGMPLFGFLPKKDAPVLASRHLGLIQAEECDRDLSAIGAWFAKNCNVAAIVSRLEKFFPAIESRPTKCPPNSVTDKSEFFFYQNVTSKRKSPLKIAIAHDEAFSFIYADMPALFNALGAETVFFSPLHDRLFPACDAVFLPGGYPELHVSQLSRNKELRAWLKMLAANGKHIYGECGAYIFLGEEFIVGNTAWEMEALLPLRFEMTKRLQALGYKEARLSFQPDIQVRGHMFHYARVCENADFNFWEIDGAPNNLEGLCQNNVWAGWLHLYPAGSAAFWKYWLRLVRERKNAD